jgi:hypothetical protein
MQRLLRSPLVHFLFGGTLLFAAVHGPPATREAAGAAVEPVVFTTSDVARILRDHARTTGLEPSPADEAALVERAIEAELLFRESLARGLDRDRSVRNWLIEQMRSLDPDAPAEPEELYAQARALGLDRTDLVVRRILVQKMRLLAARENEQQPSDDVLRDYYAAHADDYAIADRVTLWHVFSSNRAPQAAEELLAELRRGNVPPEQAAHRGETFAAPPYLRAQSRSDLARRFGAGFADQLADALPGQWSGPIASAYGRHLVWVEERTAREIPPLDAVRGQVSERWLDDQRALRLRNTLRSLRERYPLHVESAAWRERWRP